VVVLVAEDLAVDIAAAETMAATKEAMAPVMAEDFLHLTMEVKADEATAVITDTVSMAAVADTAAAVADLTATDTPAAAATATRTAEVETDTRMEENIHAVMEATIKTPTVVLTLHPTPINLQSVLVLQVLEPLSNLNLHAHQAASEQRKPTLHPTPEFPTTISSPTSSTTICGGGYESRNGF
jgi:hypothetical protein